jgi:IMP dehydrogenase
MRILDETSRTLNEYLLLPNLTTDECAPSKVDLSAPIIRHRVGDASRLRVAVPLTSAIMGAVSSPRLAIAIAQCGGLGFIHQNQSVADQAEMVSAVKRHKAGFRFSEINVKVSATLGEVAQLLRSAERDVAAVTDDGSPHGRFLGLISTTDFHPSRHRMDEPVESRMRRVEDLVTAPPSISLSDANTMVWDHHLDVLPIVNDSGQLASIVTRRDYELHKTFRNESIAADKRFVVGAGVNTRDYTERIPALVEAGADVLCIDSSDGYSVWQQQVLDYANGLPGNVAVGAGNVVDSRAFRYLAQAGAAFVKVGIGGGSICITRDQKGIGRGQASALIDVVAERDRYAEETGEYVPVCCDGGVLNDSHMAIAFALGADFMMLGRYFARFDESPSRAVRVNGQMLKEYWGEGSQRARNWSRYNHETDAPVFEEGVDGYVPYAGSVYDTVAMTLTKLKATLSSCGANNLHSFHEEAILVPVSQQSFLQNTHEVTLREVAIDDNQ